MAIATTDGRPVYAIGRLKIEGKPGAKTLTGYAFESPERLFGDPLVNTVEYEHQEGSEQKKGRAAGKTTVLPRRAGDGNNGADAEVSADGRPLMKD